ncbi:unnamed protein product [Musa acuminata subsp. malaccensis]|uniref:(wild Malaysian banana) hypothetical protein n=1 Tax=Musa acuminata subsp. malaccensis TaxID=214687 RepID=A0A804L4I8_MUSAM|nr:unnamed protein product [Musa acuminata subsp. malaccensis]
MMTLMPVSCWKKGMRTAMVRCSIVFDSSLAATMSSYYSSTSSVPRILRSIALAVSSCPRSIRELRAKGDDGGRHSGEGQADSPPPMRLAATMPMMIMSWEPILSIPRNNVLSF